MNNETFEHWYLLTVGISTQEASKRGVYDLEILRECWNDRTAELSTAQSQSDSFARLLAESSFRFANNDWLISGTVASETAVTYLITRGLAIRHPEQAAWWRMIEPREGDHANTK